MPSRAGTVWRFVVSNWPRIVAAIGAVNLFVKNHPDLPVKAREYLSGLPRRLVAVQQRRGDAARIRGVLDIIRDVAHQLDVHGTGLDGATWIRRADDIELDVRLAESQGQPEQRQSLARLRAETDELLAQLLEETARVRGLQEPGSPGPRLPPAQ